LTSTIYLIFTESYKEYMFKQHRLYEATHTFTTTYTILLGIAKVNLKLMVKQMIDIVIKL